MHDAALAMMLAELVLLLISPLWVPPRPVTPEPVAVEVVEEVEEGRVGP